MECLYIVLGAAAAVAAAAFLGLFMYLRRDRRTRSAKDQLIEARIAEMIESFGTLRTALVVGGQAERVASLPEPPQGPPKPVPLAFVAPVATPATVEAPAPSRPALPPEPSWTEKRARQLEAEGVHPNAARDQAREEGRVAVPRRRWSEVERQRRERYEQLCHDAGVAHCEEMSCFQAKFGMCECPCEGCVEATKFLGQASDEG